MPKISDAGTIDTLASYAPPTSEGGQGQPGVTADNDTSVYDLNNLTDAMGYNSPHGPTRSGQRGGAD